jgi:hypothetical protein
MRRTRNDCRADAELARACAEAVRFAAIYAAIVEALKGVDKSSMELLIEAQAERNEAADERAYWAQRARQTRPRYIETDCSEDCVGCAIGECGVVR